MFRLCRKALVGAALKALGPQSSPRDAVRVLATSMSDAAAVRAAALRLVELDTDDTATSDIIAAMAAEATDAAANGSSGGGDIDGGNGMSVVVSAMRVHGDDAEICALLSRCIANMAMLSMADAQETLARDAAAAAAGGGDGNSVGAEGSDAPEATAARRLTEAGAVEAVLSAMASSERAANAKALVWLGNALCNLVLLDHGACRRAAAYGRDGAEGTVAHFLEQCRVRKQQQQQQRRDSGDARLLAMAADLGMAALGRLLAAADDTRSPAAIAAAPAGARGGFRHENAQFETVAAVARTMHSFEADAAVQHKGWEALRLVASRPDNVALVYEAFFAADSRAFATVLRSFIAVATAGLAEGSAPEGGNGDAEAAAAAASVREPLVAAALEALVNLTAPRQDFVRSSEGAARVWPTEAAHAVAGAASSGALSQLLMSMLRRGGPRADASRTALVLHLLSHLAELDTFLGGLDCVAVLRGFAQQLSSAAAASNAAVAARATGNNASFPAVVDTRLCDMVVSKLFVCVWNLTNTPEGVRSVATLSLRDPIAALVEACRSHPLLAPHPHVLETGEKLLEKLDAVLAAPSTPATRRQ